MFTKTFCWPGDVVWSRLWIPWVTLTSHTVTLFCVVTSSPARLVEEQNVDAAGLRGGVCRAGVDRGRTLQASTISLRPPMNFPLGHITTSRGPWVTHLNLA